MLNIKYPPRSWGYSPSAVTNCLKLGHTDSAGFHQFQGIPTAVPFSGKIRARIHVNVWKIHAKKMTTMAVVTTMMTVATMTAKAARLKTTTVMTM